MISHKLWNGFATGKYVEHDRGGERSLPFREVIAGMNGIVFLEWRFHRGRKLETVNRVGPLYAVKAFRLEGKVGSFELIGRRNILLP